MALFSNHLNSAAVAYYPQVSKRVPDHTVLHLPFHALMIKGGEGKTGRSLSFEGMPGGLFTHTATVMNH